MSGNNEDIIACTVFGLARICPTRGGMLIKSEIFFHSISVFEAC